VTARACAVSLPGGRLLVASGLIAGSSSDQILVGSPRRLRLVGHLPAPTHDAAAATFERKVGVFGGGQAASTNTVIVVNPHTGSARVAGRLDEPLSDLAAVTVNGRTYLIGGYTGTRFASAVLRVGPGTRATTATPLPTGLRYAGVASLGETIYVVGGVTTGGESSAVYPSIPSAGGVRLIGRLPAPVAHAPLVAIGSRST
jgi:hypothetical protein